MNMPELWLSQSSGMLMTVMTGSHECTNMLTERVAVMIHELCTQLSTHDLTGCRGAANCSADGLAQAAYAVFALLQSVQSWV